MAIAAPAYIESSATDDLEWLSDYVITILKSPTWVSPIAQFIDEQCVLFDCSEENKLEYTICHANFKQLIDDLLAAHLLDLSVTPEQFHEFCQHGLSQNQQLHRVLVEQLLSIDDFLTFKAMMSKRNAEISHEAIKMLNEALAKQAQMQEPSFLAGSPERTQDCSFAIDPDEARTCDVLDMKSTGVIDLNASRAFGDTIVSAASLAEQSYLDCSTFEVIDASVLSPEREAAERIIEEAVAKSACSEELLKQWGLYEEQLFKAKQSSVSEEEARLEALQQREEAELADAIALSLQAEEARLQEKAAMDEADLLLHWVHGKNREPVATASSSWIVPAPTECVSAIAAEQVEPLVPASLPGPEATPEVPTASSSAQPSPVPISFKQMADKIRALPRMLHVESLAPLKVPVKRAANPVVQSIVPEVSAAELEKDADKSRCQAILEQERTFHKRVMAAPKPLAAGVRVPLGSVFSAPNAVSQSATSAYQPTEEERRQRAEHLRRQRELLIEKKNKDRRSQLEMHRPSSRPAAAAAADAAMLSSTLKKATGHGLASELTQNGAQSAALPADTACAAQQMRQALTLQLRQTLTKSYTAQ